MSQQELFNGESLYKIGSGWVFDINTYVGYSVVREGNTVSRFEEAFTLFKEAESFRVEYKQDVPLGTVRKAVSIVEMQDKEELRLEHGDKKSSK